MTHDGSGAARSWQASVQRSLRLLPRGRWYPNQPVPCPHAGQAYVLGFSDLTSHASGTLAWPSRSLAGHSPTEPPWKARMAEHCATLMLDTSAAALSRPGGLPEQPHHLRRCWAESWVRACACMCVQLCAFGTTGQQFG